jgi:hypothetical protein
VASNRSNSIAITHRHNIVVGENMCAERCFVLPENASKKTGLVLATSPTISKAPYLYERNLHHDFTRI